MIKSSMIRINYQSYASPNFGLRLRVYCGGQTRYIGVSHLLKGKLYPRHWNAKKQQFTKSAPFSAENNEIIVKFKQKYDEKAIDWTGSFAAFFSTIDVHDTNYDTGAPTIARLFSEIITDRKKRKHPDGTTKGSYECYEKTERRLQEYCKSIRLPYGQLLVKDVTSEFINSLFDWIETKKKGRGKMYVSVMLHAALVHADDLGWFDFKSLKGVRWSKKKNGSAHKYQTLTTEQCNRFLALTDDELPKNPRMHLYRDFCVFVLFTGQSACDAISLQYSDIKVIGGVSHFIFKRRKISEKQAVPCAVPINAKMQEIMDRWRKVSKDGYIFPIRNKKKLATQTTNNGDIKHFIGRLNIWLKKVGVVLGCDFPLHSYTFRHTAITNYISKDVPVVYVANMMGTSVNNCEKIYYNNQGDVRSRNKVLSIASF